MKRLAERALALAAVIGMACLGACASKDNADRAQGSTTDASSLQSSHLNCESGSHCSPSVGLLVSRKSDRATLCTATLVGDDVVATASHCIPEELRYEGAFCTGKIWVRFAQTDGFPETKIDCSTVLSASPLYDRTLNQPDIAFLKLQRAPNRPPLKINRSGILDDRHYGVIKLTPLSASPSPAKIETDECLPLSGSVVLPGSIYPDHAVIALASCEIDPMSAGAPLIDENGEIHGILQGPVPDTRIERKIRNRNLLDSSYARFSLATNMACVRLPEKDQNLALPSHCSEDADQRSDDAKRRRNELLSAQILQNWPTESYFKVSADSNIHWVTQPLSARTFDGQGLSEALNAPSRYSHFAFPVPQCLSSSSIYNLDQWLELPILGFVQGLNHYLVVHLDGGRILGTLPAKLQVETVFPFLGMPRIASLFVKIAPRDWIRVYNSEIPTCSKSSPKR
jgi:hypothetical protein